MPDENSIPTEPAKPDPKPEPKPDPKILGQRVALAIVIATVIVVIIAVWMHDYRPWTDDATLRANFIGVAPHASGHIVELQVKDNQYVKEGDLLTRRFEQHEAVIVNRHVPEVSVYKPIYLRNLP